MIKKALATAMFSALVSFSSLSFAETLEHNMQVPAKILKPLIKVENPKRHRRHWIR